MTPNTTLTRYKADKDSEVWRLTIPRIMAIVSLLTGVAGVVSMSLGTAYWVIAPRLNQRIDVRVERQLASRIIDSEQDHTRIRAEMASMITHEKELRREQLTRIEADLLYIRTRLDQLYARGGR
jgi:hypothetical protein